MVPDDSHIGRRTILSALGTAGLASVAGSRTTDLPTLVGRSRADEDDSETIARGAERVERLFEYHLQEGLHHGAQLAVYQGDELIVDLAGGVIGPADDEEELEMDGDDPDGVETDSDSRFVLFSNTKPYAAACVHVLADEGELDFDDPVVDHWPAFDDGDAEKADVTIRHVLTHQSGLPETDVDTEYDLWTDPDALAEGVEEAELEFSPGEETRYHSYSFGWIVGELVRQVTGERIDEFARENVFEPLEMDRTHIGRPGDEAGDGDGDDNNGTDADEEFEVATLVGFEPYDRVGEPGLMVNHTTEEAAEHYNREDVQRGINPAWLGLGPTRELARFYACYLNGGEIDDTRLLGEEIVEEVTDLQVEDPGGDTIGAAQRYGLGFQIGGALPDRHGVPDPDHTFGHGGLGSSLTWADTEANLAFAYVTNGIRDGYEHNDRVAELSETVREELG